MGSLPSRLLSHISSGTDCLRVSPVHDAYSAVKPLLSQTASAEPVILGSKERQGQQQYACPMTFIEHLLCVLSVMLAGVTKRRKTPCIPEVHSLLGKTILYKPTNFHDREATGAERPWTA